MKVTAKGQQSLRTHWVTGLRTPQCQNRHPYISIRQTDNKTVVETRGDCHHFMTCGTCHHAAFGVQSAAHEMISWYAVTKEQLNHMLSFEPTTKTWVFMEYLHYLEGGFE